MIGFLYYIAIWSDNFIFWFSKLGNQVQSLLYNYTSYDSSVFLAYTTILPSLAIFVLHIETSFYDKFKTFYELIMTKKSFSQIQRCKKQMT